MNQIIVYKGRTNVVLVSLGYDVSNDIITSEIREGKDSSTPLIVSWIVSFATNGIDGELRLTLDNSITDNITKSIGYMDIKRVTGGEPLNVFDGILEVLFKDTVTA